MKWPPDQRCADSQLQDDAHYLNVKQRGGMRNSGFFSGQDFSVTTPLTKQMKRGPVWAGHHCSRLLSPGANPLYMPCSSAITMTQFLLKTVSQIAERAVAGTRAFKRNCPLEFNYACCWVLLKKVLCQEFLIMLCFLPTGLQVWAIGFELGQELKHRQLL